VEITRINERAQYLEEIFLSSTDPDNPDLTVMVEPEVVESIATELASITKMDENDTRPILPNDLSSTLGTIDTLIRYNNVLHV